MTGYRRGAREDRKRRASPGHHDKTHQRNSIAGGRWRSGPDKAADRQRAVRRIDSFQRDDVGDGPDY